MKCIQIIIIIMIIIIIIKLKGLRAESEGIKQLGTKVGKSLHTEILFLVWNDVVKVFCFCVFFFFVHS